MGYNNLIAELLLFVNWMKGTSLILQIPDICWNGILFTWIRIVSNLLLLKPSECSMSASTAYRPVFTVWYSLPFLSLGWLRPTDTIRHDARHKGKCAACGEWYCHSWRLPSSSNKPGIQPIKPAFFIDWKLVVIHYFISTCTNNSSIVLFANLYAHVLMLEVVLRFRCSPSVTMIFLQLL